MRRIEPNAKRAIRYAGALVLAAALGASNAPMQVQAQATQLAIRNSSVVPAMPSDKKGQEVFRAARAARGAKILVSTESKWLWYVVGRDTLVSVPIAIGIGKTFEYHGKKYVFETPRGKRTVRGKQKDPVWTVPLWHYYEKAHQRGLEAVHLKPNEPYLLEDGTWIEIRENQVGRVNRFGNWWPFSQDYEIMFDGKIFIPPMNTIQRRVTDALGPYKLDTGDGYLIHGTHVYNEDSIGLAASHGCVRMRNKDLEVLYGLVKTGTPVYIF